MKKLAVLFYAAALLAVPRIARAGAIVEGSLGLGWQTNPTVERMPTNIMIAPGYTFADDILRAQLGLVGDLGDVENSKFDLELRPMLVVKPPVFPLYLRGILAFTNLVHSPVHVAYGGAAGLEFGALGVAFFIEAGALPRTIENQMIWVAEGRAGLHFAF